MFYKILKNYSKINSGILSPITAPTPIPTIEPNVPRCLYPIAPKYPTPVRVAPTWIAVFTTSLKIFSPSAISCAVCNAPSPARA